MQMVETQLHQLQSGGPDGVGGGEKGEGGLLMLWTSATAECILVSQILNSVPRHLLLLEVAADTMDGTDHLQSGATN